MNPSESVTLLFTLILGAWIIGLTVKLYLHTRPVRFKDPLPPSSSSISDTPFRIIGVGGFGGEFFASRWIGHYMEAMKPALLNLFPRSQYQIRHPGSRLTSRMAAEFLACEIMTSTELDQEEKFGAADAATRPLILIGHAKGGIDILELMINYPNLLGSIRLAVIMNAPLSGSRIADLIVNRITKPIGLSWPTLEELTTEFRKSFWIERWSLLPEWHRRSILKRLHVVTSEEFHSSQCAWPLFLSHRWMRLSDIRSDGLVALDSQKFPSHSCTMSSRTTGALPVTTHFFWHHGFLTCRSMLSNITEIERQETLRVIFAQHLIALREPAQDRNAKAARHNMSHLASRRRYGHLEVIK